jgi:hypothetical protein
MNPRLARRKSEENVLPGRVTLENLTAIGVANPGGLKARAGRATSWLKNAERDSNDSEGGLGSVLKKGARHLARRGTVPVFASLPKKGTVPGSAAFSG